MHIPNERKVCTNCTKNRIHQWFQNVDNDKYWWKGGLYELYELYEVLYVLTTFHPLPH